MQTKKMLKEDYDRWSWFKQGVSNKLTELETKLIAELHSKYMNHSYHIPCGCSPKTWNTWIGHLNDIHKNGIGEPNQ